MKSKADRDSVYFTRSGEQILTCFGSALLVFSLLTLTTCTVEKESSEDPLPPNIVLILADDLGYGDLACYGNSVNQTPNLDRLAAEGLRFTDFHSNGPMCSPTRAALLIGQYQQRVGIETPLGEHGEGPDSSTVMIAESLRKSGYVTGIFGKWHLGTRAVDNPIRHGFDEFRGHVHGAVDYISHVDRYGAIDWWHHDQLANEEGYNTKLITDHSVDFIERHRGESFFLYVSHSAIHFPWMTPDDKPYREIGKNYENLSKLGPHKEVGPVVRKMIGLLDESVGRIIRTLERLGLDQRTLVFFTSDNGGYLHYAGLHRGSISDNGPLRGEKTDVYEGGHRVPAIAWWPKQIQPGLVCDQTTMTFDLYPMLLELAGAEDQSASLKLDGTNIAPVIFEGAAAPERTLFWRMGRKKAVRRGPWKLVVLGDNQPELYNLVDDIGESTDVASQHPQLVEQLQAALAAWESEVG
jgi:arylsulfatase A-like enzyme